MLSLDEYKTYLINYYRYEYDNNDLKRKERKEQLKNKFSDELLQKVIIDTYSLAKEIFKTDTISHGFCSFDLPSDTTSYISLNLVGGTFTDILYTDIEERIISTHILKYIFGTQLQVSIKERVFSLTEDDVVTSNIYYSLYIQGFPNNMNDIRKQLFGKSRKRKNNLKGNINEYK